jgi:hypothetical protein
MINDQLVAALSARPRNSPGWGQVQCVKSGELRSRDGKEVIRVFADRTRCSLDYWAVREWPEFFMPIDKRESRTRDTHKRNLQRAREELARGLTRAEPRAPSSRPLRLPRASTAEPWRLPR